MNSIKTKTRNRLQTDHLDILMRIKLYQASGAQTDLDKVYWQWSAQKSPVTWYIFDFKRQTLSLSLEVKVFHELDVFGDF